MKDKFGKLISKLEIHPVLLDIGASGTPPKIWRGISRHSIYVGFDPDLRETVETHGFGFHRRVIINKVVTVRKEDAQVPFFLTRSPHCSSTLRPDRESLSDYIFSDLFTVEKEEKVPAITLEEVLKQLSLDRIDWFKTDSQGTDLRLFRSLPDNVRSRVLAVDVEPGLINAYQGEDLFIDTHNFLTGNGFWLSNLNVCGTVRMKKTTLDKVILLRKDVDFQLINNFLKHTPSWCEARYLRTLNSLNSENFVKRDWILLWIFAMLDNQSGFALDLGFEYESIYGLDEFSDIMKDAAVGNIKISVSLKRRYLLRKKIIEVIPAGVRKRLKNYLGI